VGVLGDGDASCPEGQRAEAAACKYRADETDCQARSWGDTTPHLARVALVVLQAAPATRRLARAGVVPGLPAVAAQPHLYKGGRSSLVDSKGLLVGQYHSLSWPRCLHTYMGWEAQKTPAASHLAVRLGVAQLPTSFTRLMRVRMRLRDCTASVTRGGVVCGVAADAAPTELRSLTAVDHRGRLLHVRQACEVHLRTACRAAVNAPRLRWLLASPDGRRTTCGDGLATSLSPPKTSSSPKPPFDGLNGSLSGGSACAEEKQQPI